MLINSHENIAFLQFLSYPIVLILIFKLNFLVSFFWTSTNTVPVCFCLIADDTNFKIQQIFENLGYQYDLVLGHQYLTILPKTRRVELCCTFWYKYWYWSRNMITSLYLISHSCKYNTKQVIIIIRYHTHCI